MVFNKQCFFICVILQSLGAQIIKVSKIVYFIDFCVLFIEELLLYLRQKLDPLDYVLSFLFYDETGYVINATRKFSIIMY